MKYRNSNLKDLIYGLIGMMTVLSVGCGKLSGTTSAASTSASSSSGNVNLQVNPLSGSSAASLPFRMFYALLGIHDAFASVSSFTSFKICNDTLVITDVNGNTVPVNGSTKQAGLGIISISSSATTATLLSKIDIPANTQIQEIDITSALDTSICAGVNYAVSFDAGAGPILITQNTSFKFKYSTPITISGSTESPQSLSLLFGQIVNGMVSLGTGLNDSTIQTVNVGQAQ